MDFYGVPNLPGVQAAVSSGQVPHLSGANNESGDGFGEGFNAVMNMEKQLSDKEWTKLIKQNTDANGHIDYAKVNAAAAKDDAIKFLGDHWYPIISNEQAKQLYRTAPVQSQKADIQAAYFRHLISPEDAQKALQNAEEKATSSAVKPEVGSGVIDAGRYMQDVEQTQPRLVATTDSGPQLIGQGLSIGKNATSPMFVVNKEVSPEEKARLGSQLTPFTTQDPKTGEDVTNLYGRRVSNNGDVTISPKAQSNSKLHGSSDEFNSLWQSNPDVIPQLQQAIKLHQEGINTAYSSIIHPPSTSTVATYINKLFGHVANMNDLSPKELEKIQSMLNLSHNPQSVKELEEYIKSNGSNAPAAITALADFMNSRTAYQELIKRNMVKALGNPNDYRAALGKWGVNFPNVADYYNLMSLPPKVRDFIIKGMSHFDAHFQDNFVNTAKLLDTLEKNAENEKDSRFHAFDGYMKVGM